MKIFDGQKNPLFKVVKIFDKLSTLLTILVTLFMNVRSSWLQQDDNGLPSDFDGPN